MREKASLYHDVKSFFQSIWQSYTDVIQATKKGKKSLVVKNTKKESIKNKY